VNSYDVLLWLHVLAMGYWIGSDVVVNALSRHAVRGTTLPGPERRRLWDVAGYAEGHAEAALIASLPLGFTLAAQAGLVWLDDAALAMLWLGAVAWLACLRRARARQPRAWGPACKRWDMRIRIALVAAFLYLGVLSLATGRPLDAPWLACKVLLAAGVLAAGLGVRRLRRECDAAWSAIVRDGTAADEAALRAAARRASWLVTFVWLMWIAIAWLGVAKPGLGQAP